MATKTELLKGCLKRYLRSTKQEKKVMLDELVNHMGMHRKAVIRSFRNLQMRDPWKSQKKAGRKTLYGADVEYALKDVWEISSNLCAERLHEITGEYVEILIRDGDWLHPKDTTEKLLKMSLGTMKNRIEKFQKKARKERNVTTKPSNLKELIPVRRGPWMSPIPGFGEIDTVVHCGSTLLGNMAYTVHYSDVATMWSEWNAQINKGQMRTRQSIEAMQKRLPFEMLGLDPDSGSEFVNWHLWQWCKENKIELSRSRPNHKNDNAHIEQKNYTNVRNFFGYARIDEQWQVDLMNELYAGPLRLYVNFFQPSVKCTKKERIGSRYKRRYDKAQTPYQRVMAHKKITPEVKKELSEIYKTLNPLKLKREIDRIVKQIFTRKQIVVMPEKTNANLVTV